MEFFLYVYPNDPHVQTTVTIITDHVPHPPWKLIATLNYVLENALKIISHFTHLSSISYYTVYQIKFIVKRKL